MDHTSIRKNYTEQLTGFFRGGAFPDKSSADMRFSLDCQKQRLDRLGVTMEKKFEKVGDEKETVQQYVKYPYTYTMTTCRCNYSSRFYKDKESISFGEVDNETLYMGILDQQTQENDRYTCKNCGHTDLLSKFTSGCPMCGTTYEMKQTYPCVSGYYTRPTLFNKEMAKGLSKFNLLLFSVLGAFFGLIAGISIASENASSIGEAVFMVIFALIVFIGGILLVAFLASITCLGPALATKKAVQVHDVADVKAAAETKVRMESELRTVIPDFSYEYFEEKVISLLRGIVFSDDRSKLTIYSGNDDLHFMDDIVDVEYRGAVEYVGHTVDNGILHVNVKAYVNCAYYLDGQVTKQKQTYSMVLAKKVGEENLGFTIHAVNCKKCGGSFDAIHVSTCPYCGSAYSLVEDNWVVEQVGFAKM